MKTDSVVRDDETVEDLQLAGLQLIQNKKAFRFGMDSVLLADFADVQLNDSVADLGTGNGILPILLWGRKKGEVFHCFEMIPEAAELAKRNASINHIENRMFIYQADVSDSLQYVKPGSIDAVISNPPYGQPSASLKSPNSLKAYARNQRDNTLDCFFSAAFALLKGKGKIFIVYPAPQMLHVMKALQRHHLEPKRFRLVYPYISKPAHLVLIEAVKDAKPTLHPLPPLIVYNQKGILTDELKSVYHL